MDERSTTSIGITDTRGYLQLPCNFPQSANGNLSRPDQSANHQFSLIDPVRLHFFVEFQSVVFLITTINGILIAGATRVWYSLRLQAARRSNQIVLVVPKDSIEEHIHASLMGLVDQSSALSVPKLGSILK